MNNCSKGSKIVGLVTCYNSFIVTVSDPYSCRLLRILEFVGGLWVILFCISEKKTVELINIVDKLNHKRTLCI
jgi:hypothetical protein